MLKDGGIFACQKMRKKKQNQLLLTNTFNLYNMEKLKHFATKILYSSKILVNI